MIGGGSDEKEPEDRPSIQPPSPSPPPSSPLQPAGGFGRRLLSSIRALLPASPPAASAAAPKVGLGLLLHLRTDHPILRGPAPSSPPPLDEHAVAGRGDAGSDDRAGAAPHSPASNRRDGAATPAAKVMFRPWPTKLPRHLPKPAADNVSVDQDRIFASGQPGASEEKNRLVEEEKGKVAEQQGAAGAQGSTSSPKDAHAAGVDLLHKALQQCTRGQLRAARDDGRDQDVVSPGDATTCFDIAAAAKDDQEKVHCAVKDHKVVGVIGRKGVSSTDGIAVGDQDKAVVSATANGCDRGVAGKKKKKVTVPYPQRPGKLNCPSYMSKGTCSYGYLCHFHHPMLNAKTDGSWCPSEQGNHGVAETSELNRVGLPIRQGARNCIYYMQGGACRYGKHCYFNHPEHATDAQFYAPKGWEDSALQLEKSSNHHTTVDDTSRLKESSDDATADDTSYSKKSSYHATLDNTSYSKKSSDHATLDDTSYSKKSSEHATLDDTSSITGVLPPNIFRMLLPPQKVPARTEAKVIPVKKDSNWSCTSDDSDGCCSADSSDGPLCKQEHVDSSDGPLGKQEHVDYPERPGRPECPFYMRFGDCKFASACNYHHPKDKYPERPGEPECPFYMKNRFCKFGEQCRFNHPKDSNPTARSPTNTKKYVATNEHHRPTRITLEHHMPQQLQYPERPGQPDCRYYLQFGKCKFLSACIFHHPRDVLLSGPSHSDQVGPETHVMPECSFYMKRGRCQFGSACEFRHPKDISTTEGAFGHRTGSSYDNSTRPENAEETMYPERPGEPECNYYMRHGSCKFQMDCKYHHPAVRLSRKQYDSDSPKTPSASASRARQ
uniref:Uncharacterized protein n=1 Tax=Avena sativa TaxID=4498 RepID=A0ACD5VE61_AVESA